MDPSASTPSIVLAGGGTAGHTSPLIATAERLRELAPGVRLVAVGTPKGLEARVVPAAELLDETMKVATTIASMSKTTAIVAKQAVNRSFETTLEEGLLAEQNAFYALFATEDQTEGMSAFAEKRKPEWRR